jgi:hypothetical protein
VESLGAGDVNKGQRLDPVTHHDVPLGKGPGSDLRLRWTPTLVVRIVIVVALAAA